MQAPELESIVSKSLADFYELRLQEVRKLTLGQLLRRKNPYLLRALELYRASEVVERLLTDYISASDETLFSVAFFEPVARGTSTGKALNAKGNSSCKQSWQDIAGEPDSYVKLIQLIKAESIRTKWEHDRVWDAAINRFTAEFIKDFCFPDGGVDWEKLVRFVSEEKPQKV